MDYIPEPGDYVILGGIYAGIVENVYHSEDGDYVVRVFLVKNAFQRNASEMHARDSLIMGGIRKTTKEAIIREIAVRTVELNERLEKLHVKEN